MKIKCKDHDRRVHVLEKAVIHRHDGSKCKTDSIIAGEVVVPVADVREQGNVHRAANLLEQLLAPIPAEKPKPRTRKRKRSLQVKEGVHPNAKEINEFIEEKSK